MAFDQTYCMDTLTAATQADTNPGEFIFAFLDAYDFPKATVTQVRNGGQRNIASRKEEGHVGLKNWLYFMPVREGESIHEALQVLADEEEPARHKCRFLVVTDHKDITALDTKTDERLEVSLGGLATQYLFFAPMAGLERTESFPEASADLKAAAKMGHLFDRLREINEFQTPGQLHSLNVFLTRVLFCYFAEDTGIFPKNAFTKVITEASGENGEGLSALLEQLFQVMDQAEDERPSGLPAHIAQFPYVNGSLFTDHVPTPAMRGKARRMMIECGQLQWEAVNPDIFGSMFQAVVDEGSRDAMGQHYTSVPNIMKVIRPLFLDKLYAELKAATGNRKQLEALLERLTRIRVFDPACGSGNFLIIAYKELRRLEMAIFRALQDIAGQQEFFMSGIQLSQFYGVEIADFAHEVAQLSLWLAEHQMNTLFAKEFGYAKPTLPLKDSANLIHGNSLRMDWYEVCPNDNGSEVYICGNPPFGGHGNRDDGQLNDMQQVLGQKIRNYKSLDYVACWFILASKYCNEGSVEAAFVATNSLCQGKQAGLLWPALQAEGAFISFAYQSFPWRNSAKENAGVHVVIIGLSADTQPRALYHHMEGTWHCKEVTNISPYLLEGSDAVVKERRSPLIKNTPPMLFGNMPNDGGNLLLSRQQKDALIEKEPGAKPWIKRLLGAREFLQGHERWCLWLVDASEEDIEAMPAVRERVERVRENRLASRKKATQKTASTPHLFAENRHPREGAYILVPSVTSERREYAPIGFFDSQTIATNLVFIIPNGTLYDFAILSTQMHMDWLRLVGGRLESRFRYSATIVYNTFPWPDASKAKRNAIEKLGRAVILARAAHPEKTMAELYDPDKMPDNLLEAHQALDSAVERLYRERPFRDTAERQQYLLARYESLIKAEKTAGNGNSEPARNTKNKVN